MNAKQQIRHIQQRNARVEADKAWETSWTRRAIIAGMTYFVVAVLLLWIPRGPAFFGGTGSHPRVHPIHVDPSGFQDGVD